MTSIDRSDDPADHERSDPGKRSRFAWFTETFVLKTVFRLLILAVLVLLAYDFNTIYEEASAPLPGQTVQKDPVIMEPPTRQDQLRPYLPLNNPIRRKADGPKMPGYAKPPSQDIVGAAMTFVRGPKGAVSAVGRITPGTAAAFVAFVGTQGGEIKTLYLHSPGGSVRDALAMSKRMREAGIDTVVPDDGYCASSCPLVFAGGKTRTAGRRAWIGVHQIFAVEAPRGNVQDGLAQGQAISALVQDHLSAMGVDLRAWTQAMKTPSDRLYVFTPQELTAYKLATKVAGK